MYFITGGVGFLACLIFMIVAVIFSMRGKSCAAPLTALFLSILLFLGSGFLYSRTDQSIGGIGFLQNLTRDTTVPPDLIGEWREANGSEDAYHGIRVFGRTIEVYWISDGGNNKTLYWAGTFDPPADGKEPYTWVSQNDTNRTSAAVLASGDSVKEFSYRNGKLSYSASVLGVTQTIEAEKKVWSYVPPVEDEETDETADTAETEGAEEAAEAEPAAIPSSGDLGDYHVEIRDAELAADYAGNPAIVITYSWTNNSADTISAMAAILDKAFQNGVQLDEAIIGDDSVYDMAAQTRDVRPGTTIDVECAYLLTSGTAAVEFELSDFVSPARDVLLMNFDPADLSAEEAA